MNMTVILRFLDFLPLKLYGAHYYAQDIFFCFSLIKHSGTQYTWINKVFKLSFRNEAMSDLIALMNSLTDIKGNILIPGIMDDVLPVTPEEEKLYDAIDFSCVCCIFYHFKVFIVIISKALLIVNTVYRFVSLFICYFFFFFFSKLCV